MTVKNKPGRWQSGVSGNPKGKTPGSGQLQKLRASIANDVPDILAGLVTAAKAGDMQAARLILERVLPPIKAIEQAVALQLPEGGTLTAKAAAILSALESANPPADAKTFVIRFVSPSHLDAQIHGLRADDGTLWTRQIGETEQELIDRASKQAKRSPWGFARLITDNTQGVPCSAAPEQQAALVRERSCDLKPFA